MKCKNCGAEFDEGIFCPECGTKYEEQINEKDNDAKLDTSSQKQKIEPAKSSDTKKNVKVKKNWIAIIVALILGIVGVGSCGADDTTGDQESIVDEEIEESLTEAEIELEEQVKEINVDYGFIYGGICDYVISTVDENGGDTEYLTCVLYDINNDGYKEFIIENGTCAADVVFEVYTTDGSSAIYLGEIAGYCSFYKEENGNGIYTDFCNGGYEVVNHVFIQDDGLVVETVLEQETDNYGFYEGKYIEELTYALEMELLSSINFNDYSAGIVTEEVLDSEEYQVETESYQEEFLDPNTYDDYSIEYEQEMILPNQTAIYSMDYLVEYIDEHKIEVPKERYKSQMKKVLKDSSEMIAVEASGSEKIRYSATAFVSEYYYIGKMKDNVPDGWGKIIRVVTAEERDYYGCPIVNLYSTEWGVSEDEEAIPLLVYAGEFENGYYSGYGWKFADPFEYKDYYEREIGYDYVRNSDDIMENVLASCNPIEYLGEFKKGMYDGEGVLVAYSAREIPFEMTAEEQIALTGTVADKEIELFIGEFKEGLLHGEAKHYLLGKLLYDGEYKNGWYHGEGTLYYIGTTQKEYDGEWKNDEYHGKGTLYNEDGSVKYKGKWTMGDYAN